MGDPVTMAVVGASAGAMMNKRDPLKGALLGAAGGYGGATLMGGMGAAGSSGILPSAASGSMTAGANIPAGAAFINPAGVNAAMGAGQAAGYTSAAVPSTIFSAPTAVNTAITPAVQRPLSLGMPGVESSSLYEPTFMDKVGQLGQFAQQNPVLTQMAAQTGQSLLQQQQPQLQSPGLMRGNPSQVAVPQYQVGIPKVSLI